MSRNALRSREVFVAETFLVDEISRCIPRTPYGSSTFFVNELCLEGWNHLYIEEEISTIWMNPGSLSTRSRFWKKCTKSSVPLRARPPVQLLAKWQSADDSKRYARSRTLFSKSWLGDQYHGLIFIVETPSSMSRWYQPSKQSPSTRKMSMKDTAYTVCTWISSMRKVSATNTSQPHSTPINTKLT